MFEAGLLGTLEDMVKGVNCFVADCGYAAAKRKCERLGATDDDVMSLDEIWEHCQEKKPEQSDSKEQEDDLKHEEE